ncbi:GNAT family N-acetyltransferase [Paenibacillus sp. JCM 10914]|uniref:GNAT family N-acetyltransferase n=1 Tax=Paenibacillus sp. JCM 10914 TaxID=1236974 RepID=UPI0003CC9112|nr:GNAT family N-acetyltransferase [Paenibacillus sp. JCM 10914]GAE09238.1 conserved hypothetical protein [Paenibacillus sp. JCM 10914]
MSYVASGMTTALAKEILQWKYESPYDLYNQDEDEESLQELLEQPYTAVLNETGQLVGFFCVGVAAQVPAGVQLGVYDKNQIDLGIGMLPALTGQGRGREFFTFVLKSISQLHDPPSFRLTVAEFNTRAIALYTAAGFVQTATFSNGSHTFITMEKFT